MQSAGCPVPKIVRKRGSGANGSPANASRRSLGGQPRWWNALHIRLALTINVIAVAVLVLFWFMDYRRELSAQVAVEAGRLREEARVLRVARQRASSPGDFQVFLDQFCEQMGVTASPGHHIAIFSENGAVVARAHERADSELESAMRMIRHPVERFNFDNEEYLAVRVPAGATDRIVISQSLRPIQEIIQGQAISRGASLALLAVLIFGGTTLVVLRWVRNPLRRLLRGLQAIGQRRFGTRVAGTGSSELRFLAAGVNQMAATLERAERDRLAQLQRARAIQRRLLPDARLSESGLAVSVAFEPADSVAGDLYDIIKLGDGSVLVAVLDVAGHGVAASLYTALLRAVLRGEARRTSEPVEIMRRMNEELVTVTGTSGEFVTCALARIMAGGGEVQCVGAGHEPALLLRSGGEVELLVSRGLPLGVARAEAYTATAADLSTGDRLFLFTDGVHEVPDVTGVLFGRARLIAAIRENRSDTTAGQTATVLERVRSHAGGAPLRDDLTLVCVEFIGRAAASGA